MKGFDKVEMKQLPRKENDHADALANVASIVCLACKKAKLVEFLLGKSISKNLEVSNVEDE